MVVGSTLLVQPASLMPVYAKEGGAFLAIVNLSETPCDSICDVLINRKAGEVLSGDSRNDIIPENTGMDKTFRHTQYTDILRD